MPARAILYMHFISSFYLHKIPIWYVLSLLPLFYEEIEKGAKPRGLSDASELEIISTRFLSK